MGLLGLEPTVTTTESATCCGGLPILQGLSQNSISTLQPTSEGTRSQDPGLRTTPTPSTWE